MGRTGGQAGREGEEGKQEEKKREEEGREGRRKKREGAGAADQRTLRAREALVGGQCRRSAQSVGSVERTHRRGERISLIDTGRACVRACMDRVVNGVSALLQQWDVRGGGRGGPPSEGSTTVRTPGDDDVINERRERSGEHVHHARTHAHARARARLERHVRAAWPRRVHHARWQLHAGMYSTVPRYCAVAYRTGAVCDAMRCVTAHEINVIRTGEGRRFGKSFSDHQALSANEGRMIGGRRATCLGTCLPPSSQHYREQQQKQQKGRVLSLISSPGPRRSMQSFRQCTPRPSSTVISGITSGISLSSICHAPIVSRNAEVSARCSLRCTLQR